MGLGLFERKCGILINTKRMRKIEYAKSEDEEMKGGAKREESGEIDVNMRDLSGEYGGTSRTDPADDLNPATEMMAEFESETYGMKGMAATLARLRRKEEAKHTPPQRDSQRTTDSILRR